MGVGGVKPAATQGEKTGRAKARRDVDRGRGGSTLRPYKAERANSKTGQNLQSLLGDDAVGPLDQADKDGGTAEFCSPLRYICFRDPTGPAAGSSSKDGNVFGHNFFEGFAQGRPTDGHDGVGGDFAHQRGGFAEKENLNFVAGFGERESMMKGKRGLGGVIGAPGAFHHDLESFLFWFLGGLRAEGKKGQS